MPQSKGLIPHKIKIEKTVKLGHKFETLIKLLFHRSVKGLNTQLDQDWHHP